MKVIKEKVLPVIAMLLSFALPKLVQQSIESCLQMPPGSLDGFFDNLGIIKLALDMLYAYWFRPKSKGKSFATQQKKVNR